MINSIGSDFILRERISYMQNKLEVIVKDSHMTKYIGAVAADSLQTEKIVLKGNDLTDSLTELENQMNVNASLIPVFPNQNFLSGINQNLSSTSSPSFSKISLGNPPVFSNDAVGRGYVDSKLTIGGEGITQIGTLLSVSPVLPHITSLGGCFIKGSADAYLSAGAGRNLHIGAGIHGVNYPQSLDTYFHYGNSGLLKFYNGSTLKLEIGSAVGVNSDLLVNGIRKGDDLGVVTVSGGTTIGTGGAWLELYGKLHGGQGNLVIGSAKDMFFKSYIAGSFINTLIVNNSGIYSFQNTTDSSSSTTGAATIAGGLGVAKSVSIGGSKLRLTASDGTSGSFQIAPSVAGGETAIGLYNDNTYNPSNAFFLSRFGWGSPGVVIGSGTIGTIASFQHSGVVTVHSGTESTGSTNGALVVNGGAGIAKNLFVGQNVYAAGSAFCFNNAQLPSGIDMEVGGTTPFLNLGVNGRGTTQKPINTTHAGAMLRVCPSAPTQAFQFFGRAAGSGTDNMVHSIALDGTTSIIGSGTLLYPNGNTGSPTLVTRTPGTRIVLYPNVNATESDYALGINGGELWNSVANSGAVFRWYHGNNPSATLSSTALTMNAVTLQCANVNAPGSQWGSGLKLSGASAATQDNTMTSWHRVGKVVTVMGKIVLTSMTGGGGALEIYLPQAHCAVNHKYLDVTVIKNGVKYSNAELNCASTSVYATLTDGGSNIVIVAGDSLYVRLSYISI
ncbi:MAG: hypothetical protein V4708_17580 [Bacteroidota bacterium]